MSFLRSNAATHLRYWFTDFYMTCLSTNLKEWWSRTGSNRRPEACKATALPTELRPLIYDAQPVPNNRLTTDPHCAFLNCIRSLGEVTLKSMVGLGRLELPTSRLSSARSNQLSYRPCVYAQPEPKH